MGPLAGRPPDESLTNTHASAYTRPPERTPTLRLAHGHFGNHSLLIFAARRIACPNLRHAVSTRSWKTNHFIAVPIGGTLGRPSRRTCSRTRAMPSGSAPSAISPVQ